MKTIFISQDLWDLIEEGFDNGSSSLTAAQRKELIKRDAKALQCIQQGVSKTIFPRIMGATKSKEAWESLKGEF